jgi:hypothetical protein
MHRPAVKYRGQFLNRALPQEDFEQLEAMGFVWCRNEWVWEQQIVPGLLRCLQARSGLSVRMACGLGVQ